MKDIDIDFITKVRDRLRANAGTHEVLCSYPDVMLILDALVSNAKRHITCPHCNRTITLDKKVGV